VTDFAWTPERAKALDRADPIAHVRERFVLPDGVVYLDGNSLGPLPRSAGAMVATALEGEWGDRLIAGWTESGWMEAPERLGGLIAPLVGADPDEVIVTDTTSIALVKLLVAACRARPGRATILTTSTNFPTDLYAMEAVAQLLGDVAVHRVEPAELRGSLAADAAVLALTHVDFRTAEMFDLPGLTRAAHEAGALALWDLCHSAGAVPVGLREHGVDLAVGCGYKFLNGGPGAPSFLFVRRELQSELANPLPGWLGHAAPFDFAPDFRPAAGVGQWLTSTPQVLGMAALEAALGCFEGLSIEAVRAKSVALTGLFIEAVEERAPGAVELASPRSADRRGSQVSFRHPQADRIMEVLAAGGVIGDFRPPDLCRFGFGALFLTYAQVLDAAGRVAEAAGQPSAP
jgi:kynureninase